MGSGISLLMIRVGNWENGMREKRLDGSIAVPFCYQSKASGIGDQHTIPSFGIPANFTLSDELKRQNCSCILALWIMKQRFG